MANTLKFGNGNWATKDGSTLAYNDESGFNPLPFDFTRASSATVVNKNGLIETVASGIPRIDFKDNTKGALILEPSRTNLLPYSEDFSNSGWTKNNTTVTSGFTSPDGTNNAYLMTDDATDSKHGVYDIDVLSQDGNVYTRSVFVKKGTARYVVLSARHLPTSSSTSWIYDFDINNWVLTGLSGVGQSIEDYGNGWYRLSISHISDSNFNNDFSIGISSGATISDTSYSGSGDTLYIYGAQVELGSYSTSLINTSGSAVTREADVCNNGANSEVINSTEGVFYADIAALTKINPSGNITLSDGTGDNRIYIYYLIDNSISVIYNVNATGASINDFSLSNITDQTKIAVRWGNSNVSVWINGTSVLSNTTSNFLPNTLNVLSFEKPAGSGPFEGKTKDVRVYNTALSDSELAALTTI